MPGSAKMNIFDYGGLPIPLLKGLESVSGSMNLDYRIAFINDQKRLRTLSERLRSVSALAVDIETINWWHPPTEQVALIQVAYRANKELRVAVVDTLAQL